MTDHDDIHMQDRQQKFKLLSLENIAQLIVYAILLTVAYSALKSDVRNTDTNVQYQGKRIDSLERSRDADHDLLLEIRGEVKAARDRIERFPVPK